MKALARYIVTGRWQAIAVTAVSAVLAFLFPPLNYLGAATVALVTLHVGKFDGLRVLVMACVLTVLFYQLVGIPAAVVVVLLVMLWLPCWFIAAVLQQTGSLGYALKAAVLFGVSMLLLLYAIYGDPAAWWLERLRELVVELKAAGLNLQQLTEPMLQRIAALMSGAVLASLVLGIAASLLLARWWQSVLVHPGGFRDEFYQLRLGAAAGMLTLGIMVLSRVLQGSASDLAAQLAMIMLVPYLLTGLAVIHSLLRRRRTRQRLAGWLVYYSCFCAAGHADTGRWRFTGYLG